MTLEVFVSVCTLVFIVVGFGWGIYVYSRQMNAQLFLTFTDRFEAVMESFADACNGDCPIDIFASPPEPSARLTAATIRYLNLCSEEFYLYRRGFLSKHIWSIWEAEIKEALRSSLIRREWPSVKSAYRSFHEFQRFVEDQHAVQGNLVDRKY